MILKNFTVSVFHNTARKNKIFEIQASNETTAVLKAVDSYHGLFIQEDPEGGMNTEQLKALLQASYNHSHELARVTVSNLGYFTDIL